jgi:hypothetical protein
VVIDDASSMPVHKAIDVITRGNDTIISGDGEQMPASLNSGDNVTDTESIMDSCLSISLQKYGLYSADDENLTKIRNFKFYDMKLCTFPKAMKEEPNIRIARVKGCYNRASKSNDIEAEAVVREMMKRIKGSKEKVSAGIITFSSGQKEMIEDMLTKELARNKITEDLMHIEDEPIFVRDVDEVRGHERDTILISAGIGKDSAGRLTTDLSPFDRENGERRLNAAMAYARNELVLFTSLDSSEIPAGKGKGTDALKDLIVYADKGLPPGKIRDDAMCGIIGKAIEEKGFTVHYDVGRSRTAVDIAIVDPQHIDRYILGVLVDSGPFVGPNAMDNEFTNIRGLEEAGWEIKRVWTLDWLRDPERTINDIAEIINRRADDAGRWSPKRKESRTIDIITAKRPAAVKVRKEISGKRQYIKANIAEKTVSLEALYSTSSRSMIERDITKVIETESPVSVSVAAKRLCDAYGMKMSAKFLEHITMMIERMDVVHTVSPGNAKILWMDADSVRAYDIYRVPVEGEKRNMRNIASRELTNAVSDVVTERTSASTNDIVTAVAKIFGNHEITDEDKRIIVRCIDIAIDEKMIRKDSKGNISLYS